MTDKKPGLIRRLFGAIARVYRGFRSVILNLLFICIVALIAVSIFSGDDKIKVPPTAALVLNLTGDLVEEKRWTDPIATAINESLGGQEDAPEVLVSDVVTVIKNATGDNRIQALVLDLSMLGSGSLDKMQLIGAAIEEFKASGKKVLAFGGYYGQGQYYLASYADEISLSPMGAVILEGYGSYPMYYKNALEKLKINTHVFRVGTYKSAVEPFLRNDMSDEAKEANVAWLNELWSDYKQQVAARRGFAADNFDETYAALLEKLQAAEGDLSQYAVNAGLVDNIKTREAFRRDLIAIVGENDDHTYNHVTFGNYAKLVIPSKQFDNPLTDKVAIVVARGVIVDGTAKAGTIGGDSTAALLRQARHDDKVKAVVLRIDSPGGSAYASEIIGQEIRLLREAGKPVIASMGSVAASGGYWIAAPANEIWAAPTTITGSIGIFGLLHTAEDAMPALGLNVDGVGTTELAGLSAGLPLFKGLDPKAKDLFQLLIERGYTEFLTMVGENRNMTTTEVDTVAQGRVWTGSKALELGLVDKLGNINDAIKAAAEKAGLSQYDVKVVKQELTPSEQMIKDLLGEASAKGWLPQGGVSAEQKLLGKLTKQLKQDFVLLNQFNDPNGVYSYCVSCSIN
ncbi:protease-4 [Rheinheimera pacifica]|uniref:signal peptide peptidase SppA n=1 Tax=Rheinheimera pacifica TaxID=173990 RepID=UPI000CB4018A|nr:signal peptide peptidase SppA [Rheinheimera pacifica]MDR6982764.1 protease-4 [Rheinheimera pacifica]PKM20206.1 MAG: signal peptide peptidase SppA [Gammaproteobacteria bacterium HGW-Gammaproteobacteria-15]